MGLCCVGEDIESTELEESYGSSLTFTGIKNDRKLTNKSVLIFMGCFFIVLAGLLTYCMVNGDLYRLYNGYDDCGNVCGRPNIKNKNIYLDCFGKDMTDKPYLLTITDKTMMMTKCVADCNAEGGYLAYLNRCFAASRSSSGIIIVNKGFSYFASEINDDLQMCWKEIIILSILALVFSTITLILFRYATAFVVWFTLIGLVLICVAASIYFWILFIRASRAVEESYDYEKQYWKTYMTTLVIVFFSGTCVIIVIIIFMLKRIKLVIQLFKEAAKAIGAMPQMLLQPIITFITLVVIISFAYYFSLWIQSSGNLEIADTYIINGSKIINPNVLAYKQNIVETFTTWYNLFGVLWMIHFAIGCQNMIIAGCTATWFFTRNKDNLASPLTTSTCNLVKYHLGTVALGSLIITIVEFIKSVVRSLRTTMKHSKTIIAFLLYYCLQGLLDWLEELFKYFSRNAYIQTAIYGLPFCEAGKRAFKLLVNNIFKVAAINSVGDFVLYFAKIFIVLSTVLIGFEMLRDNKELHHVWFPLVVAGCISYFIAHCFLTVFEMAIDTIFLCFCEDCEVNDGISRPYFMSRNLMEFVENTNKVLNKNWEADQASWENGPKRVLHAPA